MWITPKLDWTRTDYYNFEDLNRVENNSEVVTGLVGYFIGLPPLSFLTERSMKRIEFADSLNRIEGNQDVLRQRYTPFGWMHRTAGSDAQKVPKKVEGTAEDVRLDAVDLWENRNLIHRGNMNSLVGWLSNGVSVIEMENGFIKNRFTGSTSTPGIRPAQYFSLSKGIYTLTIRLDADNLSKPLIAYLIGGTPQLSFPLTNGEGMSTISRRLDIPADRANDFLYILSSGTPIGEYVLYDWMKLEKGSTATPWQPAPEDNIPWYEPTKTVELAPINLSSLDQYESSLIEWETDTPDGTRVDVEYSFDEESWTAIQSGQSLPFRKGDWLTGKVLYLRQRLFTNDQSKTPVIRNLRYEINGYQTKVEWKANDPFDFNDALRLEHNLNLLYEHYKGNAEAVPICGAFICGEEVI